VIVRNYRQLAVTPERKAALRIIEAGPEAIATPAALKRKIRRRGNILSIDGRNFDLTEFERVFVVGGGKAAFPAAVFLEKILADRLTGGAVVDVRGKSLEKIKVFIGDHPYPSARNVRATREIIKTLKSAGKNDLVIAVVSGGGSALLAAPAKVGLKELRETTKKLILEKADIREINTVRKHLSLIGGGNLAKLAYPAEVVGLIFSDVPFSDLGLVASGPTFRDKTGRSEAGKIIRKYNLPEIVLSETPKNPQFFRNVSNFLIVDNRTGLEAMAEKARELGFRSEIKTSRLRGEARRVGAEIVATTAVKKTIRLFGGETAVKVRGKGKGGRNQELVLAALGKLKPNQLIAAIDSDGKDSVSGAAGALADRLTGKKAKKLRLNSEEYLRDNNSYGFFRKTGDVIITGATGSNVADFTIIINR
jgi:glycerate-2-kinase